jgi:arylsulfatase A-like enzyme
MVGKVMQALQEHGFSDNTLVIFSADNGAETHAFERLEKFDQWSSGKYRGLKRDIYEGGHRVPFIVKWPGRVKKGVRSDEVVSQVDLASTFAKIIDYPLAKTEAIDSYNLLPVLAGKKYSKPLRVATVQNTSAKKFALRQGDWVLINAPTGAAKKEQQDYLNHFGLEPYGKENQGLLFNLKNDPRQSNNLYSQYPSKVKKMRALLESYLEGKPCAPNKR